MTDNTNDRKWYELDAPWDNLREVEGKLMELGQSREWLELVGETSNLTHATTDEIWNGMARAIVDYLEGLR